MKYTLTIDVNKQININEGKKDNNNNPLPQEIKTILSYTEVTTIPNADTGKTEFTVAELKTSIRSKYPVTPSTDEKLYAGKTLLVNDNDVVTNNKLYYVITQTYVAPSDN